MNNSSRKEGETSSLDDLGGEPAGKTAGRGSVWMYAGTNRYAFIDEEKVRVARAARFYRFRASACSRAAANCSLMQASERVAFLRRRGKLTAVLHGRKKQNMRDLCRPPDFSSRFVWSTVLVLRKLSSEVSLPSFLIATDNCASDIDLRLDVHTIRLQHG